MRFAKRGDGKESTKSIAGHDDGFVLERLDFSLLRFAFVNHIAISCATLHQKNGKLSTWRTLDPLSE